MIHAALLVAVQPQPLPALTAVVPVPPLDVSVCDVGATVKLHAALSVMVTVRPATVSVPVREALPVFAVTL